MANEDMDWLSKIEARLETIKRATMGINAPMVWVAAATPPHYVAPRAICGAAILVKDIDALITHIRFLQETLKDIDNTEGMGDD